MVTVKHPKYLVTTNRIDIVIKILYLELSSKAKKYAQKIYSEHIDSFTLGKFQEPGSESKKNLQNFFDEFRNLETSIKAEGFKSELGAIPLASDGSILNGSHRIAAAMRNNLDFVSVCFENKNPVKYDYNFFLNRNMDPIDLDNALLRMIELKNTVYTAIIWPVCTVEEQSLKEIFPNYIFYRELDFNLEELHKFIIHVYMNQEWIGDLENDYIGAYQKAKNCFKKNIKIKIITFEENSFSKIVKTKSEFRRNFSLGKDSIHITDNKKETLNICELVINENAIHFLKNSKLIDYSKISDNLNNFKTHIAEHDLDLDNYAINSGFVMELYGFRKSLDFDVLKINNDDRSNEEMYSSHNSQLVYFESKVEDLLFDPRNYFKYQNVKIISLRNVYNFKRNRLEEKDLQDLKLLKNISFYSDANYKSQLKKTVKFFILRQKIKLYVWVVNLLDKLKLLKIVLFIKQKVKF